MSHTAISILHIERHNAEPVLDDLAVRLAAADVGGDAGEKVEGAARLRARHLPIVTIAIILPLLLLLLLPLIVIVVMIYIYIYIYI